MVLFHAMSEPTFRREVFAADNPTGLACVVAGIGGTIPEFIQPAETLNELGYDAAVYEYDQDVYLSGEPDQLPALLAELGDDFEDIGSDYNRKLFTGASGGSFFAYTLQQRAEGPQLGLFAAGGIELSKIFTHSLAFRAFGIRKAYARNGYDEEGLREIWRDIDISPEKPPAADKSLCVVLGGMDYIVNYAKARRTYVAWQKAGVPVRILTKPQLGHAGTLRWFKENIHTMLAEGTEL